jgi:hypothetical protein
VPPRHVHPTRTAVTSIRDAGGRTNRTS